MDPRDSDLHLKTLQEMLEKQENLVARREVRSPL
jgi:hypothetical protein